MTLFESPPLQRKIHRNPGNLRISQTCYAFGRAQSVRDFVLKSCLVIIRLAKNHVVLGVSGFSSHMLLRSTIECPFSSW